MSPECPPASGDKLFDEWQNEWFYCPDEAEENALHRKVMESWGEPRTLEPEDGLDDASAWRFADHFSTCKKEPRATFSAQRNVDTGFPEHGRVNLPRLMTYLMARESEWEPFHTLYLIVDSRDWLLTRRSGFPLLVDG